MNASYPSRARPAVRRSLHEDPVGAMAIARHYIRDVVYGANDGLITTFAVVVGAMGGGLSPRALLILGSANLFADGLSMGVGNYLSIRSHESALAAQDRPQEETRPLRHGTATWLAFMAAGAVPLASFAVAADLAFALSIGLTFTMLFTVGALRAVVTAERWWTGGLEMLSLGGAVAVVAYASGAAAARLISET